MLAFCDWIKVLLQEILLLENKFISEETI